MAVSQGPRRASGIIGDDDNIRAPRCAGRLQTMEQPPQTCRAAVGRNRDQISFRHTPILLHRRAPLDQDGLSALYPCVVLSNGVAGQ